MPSSPSPSSCPCLVPVSLFFSMHCPVRNNTKIKYLVRRRGEEELDLRGEEELDLVVRRRGGAGSASSSFLGRRRRTRCCWTTATSRRAPATASATPTTKMTTRTRRRRSGARTTTWSAPSSPASGRSPQSYRYAVESIQRSVVQLRVHCLPAY